MNGAIKSVDGGFISLEGIKIIDKKQVGESFYVLGYTDYQKVDRVSLATFYVHNKKIVEQDYNYKIG